MTKEQFWDLFKEVEIGYECPNCHNGTIIAEGGEVKCAGECGVIFGIIRAMFEPPPGMSRPGSKREQFIDDLNELIKTIENRSQAAINGNSRDMSRCEEEYIDYYRHFIGVYAPKEE